LSKAKAFFSGKKFNTVQLVDGSFIEFLGESIELGQDIYIVSGSNSNPAPDGSYVTKTNVNFTIGSGKVTLVSPVNVVPVEQTPILQAQSADIEYADKGYQSDKQKRYPIDTVEHIRAAWNYINKTDDAEQYSAADLKKVKDAIIDAWKEKIDPKGPPSAQSQSEEIPAKAEGEAEVKLADATPTVDIMSLVDRISALEDSIGDIQNSLSQLATLYVSQDNFSKVEQDFNATKQMMSSVVETVNILANQPSSEPIEKEVINLSLTSVPKEVKESQAYKVMQHARLV